MHHVVRVESSYNPYAIGVVGARLVRQPRSLPEALATVRMLERGGYNFSLGLAQVNRHNLEKFGLSSYETAFQACPNLQAGSRILAECHGRSGGDWGKSLSCYYSGNHVTGFRHGYVQKVFASMRASGLRVGPGQDDPPIALVGTPSRRVALTADPAPAPLPPGKQGAIAPQSRSSPPHSLVTTASAGANHRPNASLAGQPGEHSLANEDVKGAQVAPEIDQAFVF